MAASRFDKTCFNGGRRASPGSFPRRVTHAYMHRHQTYAQRRRHTPRKEATVRTEHAAERRTLSRNKLAPDQRGTRRARFRCAPGTGMVVDPSYACPFPVNLAYATAN
jgi:hypothetical protein